MKMRTLTITSLLLLSAAAQAEFLPVCERTPQVKSALQVLTRKACADITLNDLELIKRVAVNNRGIVQFKADDFSGLPNLEILNIRSNPYRTLPPGLLAELPKLKTLVMIGTGITELPEDFLEYNTALANLHLHKNLKLNRLPEAVWNRLATFQHWVSLDFDRRLDTVNDGRLQQTFGHRGDLEFLLH